MVGLQTWTLSHQTGCTSKAKLGCTFPLPHVNHTNSLLPFSAASTTVFSASQILELSAIVSTEGWKRNREQHKQLLLNLLLLTAHMSWASWASSSCSLNTAHKHSACVASFTAFFSTFPFPRGEYLSTVSPCCSFYMSHKIRNGIFWTEHLFSLALLTEIYIPQPNLTFITLKDLSIFSIWGSNSTSSETEHHRGK